MGLQPVINGQGFYNRPSAGGGGGGGDLFAANNLSDLANKPTALTNLGGTTLGVNLFKIANPGAITFPRFNADNSVSSLSASDFRTAIGAGTSSFDGAYASLTGKPTLGTAAALDVGLGVGSAVVRADLPSSPGTPAIAFFSSGRTTYLWDDGAPGPDNEVQLPSTSGQIALTSQIPSVASFALKTGETFTGLIQFSGTGHAGIKVNNLTTAQKNALTPAAGMIVFDTDLARFQSYSGTAWVSHVRLSGDTMTGALAITQGTANTGILSSTGYSLTGSNATNMFDLAGTWNTSGTPTAFKIAITNTASNASSLLIDLSAGAAGATSRFKVDALGILTIGGAGANSKIIFNGSSVTSNIASNGYGDGLILTGSLSISGALSITGGSTILYRANGNLFFGSGSILGWASTSDGSGTIDAQIVREAASHLTARLGTTAQIFSISNTWTSTTSFERFKIDWSATANTCRIGTSKGGGGGSTRALHLEVGDSAAIKISTAGAIDFAMLATTTETITPDKTITVSIAGVAVKIPCL